MLGGVVLPLGLLGAWLARTAGRSGEELLRTRLETAMSAVVTEIGARWIQRRASLLALTEDTALHAALRRESASIGAADAAISSAMRAALSRGGDTIDVAVVRDRDGRERWAPPASESRSESPAPSEAALTVSLAIHNSWSGERLGTVEARVPFGRLVGVGPAGVAGIGSVLAAFDRGTGASLLPLPFDADVLRGDRFLWSGEQWLTHRRTLDEPPLELAIAAPLSPYTAPFERAARDGVVLLLAVVAVAFAVATILTRRTTRSLVSLADAAEAVSRGDLERRVEAVSQDEVGRVARAFNTMTENLGRTLRELAQRQSLAAVGEFAASLAHEVRNPLTSVRIDLQRVEEKLPADSPLRGPLGRALREIRRLDGTVSGTLRVARSGRIALETIDLRGALDAALHGAEAEFAQRGAIVNAPIPRGEPVWLRGDGAALEQVFLNLLLNAAQALDGKGGRAGVDLELAENDVLVTVWDSGPGMTPDVLERIFEPLYSTKREGTGLGLSIARRIVEAHAGTIDVDSRPGEGTRVRVRLPRAPTGAAASAMT